MLPMNYRPPSDCGRATPNTTNIYNAHPSSIPILHRDNYTETYAAFKSRQLNCPICRLGFKQG